MLQVHGSTATSLVNLVNAGEIDQGRTGRDAVRQSEQAAPPSGSGPAGSAIMPLDSNTFQQLADTVARFVDQRLIPNEDRLEEEGKVPPELLQEMKDLGLFGLTIPQDYGGLGLNMEEEVLLTFELGRAAPALSSAFATPPGPPPQQ